MAGQVIWTEHLRLSPPWKRPEEATEEYCAKLHKELLLCASDLWLRYVIDASGSPLPFPRADLASKRLVSARHSQQRSLYSTEALRGVKREF